MIKRVQKILKKYDLSPSQLADQIQIQRSGISHILSGRNKPSLDFVMKTLSAFPEVNSEWLIFGNGEMLKTLLTEENEIHAQQVHYGNLKPEEKASDQKMQTRNLGNKEIDRIIIFYQDQTFDEFNPK